MVERKRAFAKAAGRGHQEGRREMQDEILRMIAGVSRQGSAEDVINEIINKIHSEGKARAESDGVL